MPVVTPDMTEPRVSSPGPSTGRRVATDSSHFRRGLMLMLMTLVLPGSAQLAAGRKQTGRIALRTWFGLVATLALLFVVGLAFNSFVFWFLSNTFVLGVVRIVLMAMAVGWAYLFIDAWRIADPLAMRQKQRLAMVGVNGVLCFSVAGSLLFASHIVGVQKDFLSSMFSNGQATAAHAGRYNVLLLGGDSGADRWGLRPDSISVASIDEQTGKTVIFGLPRNMLNFPFAKDSIMSRQFPHGYDCGGQCELNSLATWAADHKPLFRGVRNPGVEATKEAVEGITGLKINYYAMVNLKGFEDLVDAVGGVKLRVRDPIPIGGIGHAVTGHIKPGYRKLNGYETLWFARSRVAADDYSRMARQKCVMNAMLHQLSPKTVVLKFDDIAKASKALITTDLPQSEVDTFMELALKARKTPIRTVSFVPPLISTSRPDIDKIRSSVKKAIKVSEGKQKKGTKSRPTTPISTQTNGGGSIGNLRQGYAANQANDLNSVC
jgi:LCP family protein required for cell wall assembly